MSSECLVLVFPKFSRLARPGRRGQMKHCPAWRGRERCPKVANGVLATAYRGSLMGCQLHDSAVRPLVLTPDRGPAQ